VRRKNGLWERESMGVSYWEGENRWCRVILEGDGEKKKERIEEEASIYGHGWWEDERREGEKERRGHHCRWTMEATGRKSTQETERGWKGWKGWRCGIMRGKGVERQMYQDEPFYSLLFRNNKSRC
jgi:hypothetical protein